MLDKRRLFLDGPDPLPPGSLAEFIEAVWWPVTKTKCTDSTIRGYRYIVGGVGPKGKEIKGRLERFMLMQLDSIRLEHLQPWVNEMIEEGLSAKRINGVFAVMADILELARLTDRYHSLDHKLVILPEIEVKVREDLYIWKVRALEDAAKGTELEGPVWAAGYIGLRRNEVCGVKVPHVVFHDDKATINIQDNRQPQGETNKLKSKKRGRIKKITVPRWMGEKLLSFAEPGAIYIFSHKGKPIHPDHITKRMGELCTKAKIGEHWDFKTLRAACRSNLKAAGAEEVDTMRMLGHSSDRTSRIYQDRRPDEEAKAYDRMMVLEG